MEQLAKSDFGKALTEYLKEEIDKMSNIDNIDTKNTEDLIGRKQAKKILKELFSFLDSARQEKHEPKKTDYL